MKNSKDIHEALIERIKKRRDHFLDWQDYIDEQVFPKAGEYLLIQNLFLFYQALDLSEKKANELSSQDCVPNQKIEELAAFLKGQSSFENVPSLFNEVMREHDLSDVEKKQLELLLLIPDKVFFQGNHLEDVKMIHYRIKYLEDVLSFLSEENKENQEADE